MLLSVGLVLLKHKQTANRSKALPGAITCSYRTRNVVLYIILTLFWKPTQAVVFGQQFFVSRKTARCFLFNVVFTAFRSH